MYLYQTGFIKKRVGMMNKDFKQFSIDLGERESAGNYNISNKFHFLGRWQLGKMRMYDLGYSLDGYCPKGGELKAPLTTPQFLMNSQLQDKLFIRHITDLRDHIVKHHSDVLGTVISDCRLSISGLVAGSHLLGSGGIDKFIRTGIIEVDGMGTKVSEYINKFTDYDLFTNLVIGPVI